MLRITIDLLRHGDESQKTTLGIMHIWNTGTGSLTKGNYKFKIFQKGKNNTVWKSGDVLDFPRKKLLSWDLLFRCLQQVIENRNK